MSYQSSLDVLPPSDGGQTIRMLLLDDNNFDRARIRRMSRKTGFPVEIDEVDSIEKMQAAVQLTSYDVIMIDYRLPVGDGLDALEAIQGNPRNQGAGTIMITGNAELDTAVSALRNGCHDFLSKDGMTAEVLHRAMRHAMVAAARNRQEALHNEQVRLRIRDGVLSAFRDKEVRTEVLSVFAPYLEQLVMRQAAIDASSLAEVLDAMLRDDEFVFH